MKISKKYLIFYSVIILIATLFLLFLVVIKFNDPNLPDWIMAIGYLFFAASIFSFLRNLKSIRVTENGVQIRRSIFQKVSVDKADILKIEEGEFWYRGSSNSQIVYAGYYLSINTLTKNYKTTSLNEPSYDSLRKEVKENFGKLVTLDKNYRGDRLSWWYVILMLLPSVWLLVEIVV